MAPDADVLQAPSDATRAGVRSSTRSRLSAGTLWLGRDTVRPGTIQQPANARRSSAARAEQRRTSSVSVKMVSPADSRLRRGRFGGTDLCHVSPHGSRLADALVKKRVGQLVSPKPHWDIGNSSFEDHHPAPAASQRRARRGAEEASHPVRRPTARVIPPPQRALIAWAIRPATIGQVPSARRGAASIPVDVVGTRIPRSPGTWIELVCRFADHIGLEALRRHRRPTGLHETALQARSHRLDDPSSWSCMATTVPGTGRPGPAYAWRLGLDHTRRIHRHANRLTGSRPCKRDHLLSVAIARRNMAGRSP